MRATGWATGLAASRSATCARHAACTGSPVRSRSRSTFPSSQDDAVAQVGPRDRRPRALPGRARQLRAPGAARGRRRSGRWVGACADAVFVVTSRERLRLAGEESFPLEPLAVDSEAVDLFVARARAQRPDFALTAANRDDVGRIVRLLDGLPLAIELAAARVRVLSPAQLVERMRDRFALLAGARGDVARQATLRAAIDWSWDLLVPWEQAALAQCSVFEGGFTLELAEQVIDLAAWPEAPPVMDAVQALVDKSLLRTLGAGRRRPLRPRRALLRHVRQHPRVRGRATARDGAGRASASPRSATAAASPASATTRRSRRCTAPTAPSGAVRWRSSSTTSSPRAGARSRAATPRRRSRPTAPPGRCWTCAARSSSPPSWAPRCWPWRAWTMPQRGARYR